MFLYICYYFFWISNTHEKIAHRDPPEILYQSNQFELSLIDQVIIDSKIRLFSDSGSLHKKGLYLYWKDDLIGACNSLRQTVLQNYELAKKDFILVESFCKNSYGGSHEQSYIKNHFWFFNIHKPTAIYNLWRTKTDACRYIQWDFNLASFLHHHIFF